MNQTIEEKILKALNVFHTDIEWLKENATTKKDVIAEREHTRKIIREEIEVNNKVLGKVFKVEMAEVKQEIVNGVNKGFQKTAVQFDEQKERIEMIEEHIGLKPHKN